MESMKYFGLEDSCNGNTESLYSTVQRVYLKCGKKEDRQRDLRLTLNNSPKDICLHLTDDDDPFFLFCLVITEEDFKTIKIQQSLLVDFVHFPRQFVKLLDQCKSDIATQGPRFLLVLESKEEGDITRSTYLKIVETNLFKNLCHLDLQIKCGSDTEIKKLMAQQIKNLKETASSNFKELAHTSSRLNDCIQRLELKRVEAEKLCEKWEEEKRNMFFNTNAEINREKERLLSAKLQWQAEEEERKQEMQLKHETAINNLDTQIAKLSAQNHMLFEKNCEGESTKRERCGQLEFLEKENTSLQNEITLLRKQNSKLDQDYHEKNKLANSQKTKLALLDQELKDTDAALNKQLELLKNANEQRSRLEEGFREKESSLERKQVSLNNVSQELMKANDILRRLQAELVALRSKLNKRTHIALEQERLLNCKTEELAMSERKVNQLQENIEDAATKEKKLSELLKAANEKVIAQEKYISNDKLAIQWLVRQMAHLPKNPSGPGFPTALDLKLPPLNADLDYERLAPFIHAGVQSSPYLAEAQKPPTTASTSAEDALNGMKKSDMMVTSRPSTYQQSLLNAATNTTEAAWEGLPKSNVVSSRPDTYHQSPLNAATYSAEVALNGLKKSDMMATSRPGIYQQSSLNAETNTAKAARKGLPKSNVVTSRPGTYQQLPLNSASNTAETASSLPTKSKFVFISRPGTYQPPHVTSAYFPRKGNGGIGK